MAGRSGDDRDRPSWREIDRRKDRSKHVSQDRTGAKPHEKTDWGKQRYKKAVDEFLFSDTPQETPQAKKARESLHKKYNTPEFEEAVKKFLDKHGIPQHWETLSMMIECKAPEIVIPSIEMMAAMAPSQRPSEKMLFVNSLRIIARKNKDEETAGLARKLAKKLG